MLAGRTNIPDKPQARSSGDSAASTAILAAHINRAPVVAEGRASRRVPADKDSMPSSRRYADGHQHDLARQAPFILTAGELDDHGEPATTLVAQAQEDLNRLYDLVRHARYDVFLCDDEGVVIDHRGNPTDPDRFKGTGTRRGGAWPDAADRMNSEQIQEAKGALAAPIFDADVNLAGALGISSVHQDLSEWPHALARAVIQTSARAIEERLFRERYRRTWIIAVAPQDIERFAMLIAVDRGSTHRRADRHARDVAGNETGPANSVSPWALFERILRFRPREGEALPHGRLAPRMVGAHYSAATCAALWPNPAGVPAIAPRLDAIGQVRQVLPPRTRGGLCWACYGACASMSMPTSSRISISSGSPTSRGCRDVISRGRSSNRWAPRRTAM